MPTLTTETSKSRTEIRQVEVSAPTAIEPLLHQIVED